MNRRGEAGHVLPLIAICLAVLMGFGGMGVDVGYWEYNQREQQNAADAAAIGGAQQLIYDGCGDKTDATTAADADSSDNGFTNNSNGVTVIVQNPPPSGNPFAGNNCAVEAQVASTQVPTFLTRVLGFNTMNETTQATAEVVYNNGGCIYMLDPNQNTNFNNSDIVAPKCSIWMDGTANLHSATVDAMSIGEANYAGSNNGGTFSGGSPTQILPVADPCPEVAACASLTNNPPSTSPCNGTYSGSGTLLPGCYNNLNLNGQNVTLQPNSTSSLFVFEGTLNANMATIVGNGVTLYMAAGASANFNKTTALTLTPPTTGPNAGISYYQVKGNSNTVNLNSGTTNVGGMIYAPSAQLNYNGSNGQYTVIVAAYGNFNVSSGSDFGNPIAGSTLIPNVVLAQ